MCGNRSTKYLCHRTDTNCTSPYSPSATIQDHTGPLHCHAACGLEHCSHGFVKSKLQRGAHAVKDARISSKSPGIVCLASSCLCLSRGWVLFVCLIITLFTPPLCPAAKDHTQGFASYDQILSITSSGWTRDCTVAPTDVLLISSLEPSSQLPRSSVGFQVKGPFGLGWGQESSA